MEAFGNPFQFQEVKQSFGKLRAVVLVSAMAGLLSAHGATIAWDAPQAISGAGDVNTNGSYLGSWAPYNPLAKAFPVNGVIFYGDDLGITYTALANGSQVFGPHTTSNTNYNALLSNGIYADGTNAVFTLNGDGNRPLVIGREYLVQLWVSDSRSFGAGRTESISGSRPVSFRTASGMGQYMVGRFTADTANQTFTLSANTSAQVNLLQVRDVTPGTPPTVNALADHSALAVGQSTLVRVTVIPGSNATITNVTLDASSIGVATPVQLIPAGGSVYTNTVTVGTGTLYGNQTIVVTATDAAGSQGRSSIALFLPMPVPYKAALKELEAWRSNRFGMFIHWGPATLTGQEISWSRANSNPQCPNDGPTPVDVYDQLYKQFNPTNFNANSWVASAKAAGMKYVVFTTKHHDGFLLWDSKASSYNIMKTPFARDVCRELADATHAAGLKLGWYFSAPDWKDPRFRNAHHGDFVKTMQAELRELLTHYGKVDLLWFDFDARTNNFDVPNTYAMCRRLQPDIVIDNRLDLGSSADYAAQPPVGPWADYYTPEQRIGDFDNQNPWETCMTLGTQWSWMPNDNIKTLRESLNTLLLCAGADGNLLYNAGPQPSGAFEQRYVEVLAGIGAWLTKNGESVYGTRGGPYRPSTLSASTRKGNAIYVHLLPPQKIVNLAALPSTILSASLLTGGNVVFTQTVSGITLRLSNDALTNSIATIKLALSSSAMDIPTRPAAALSTPPPTNNWRSVRMIADSSDVNTEGAPILAWQASGSDYGGYPDQTVNGVTFQRKVTTANGVSFTMSGLGGYDPTAFVSTRTFTGPDAAAYGRILAGARFGETEPIVLRFSGLTVGHTYLIQIWAADYREFLDVRTESITTSGGGDINVPALHYLTGDGFTPGSGRGEYVIGTFNAGTSNATFNLTGNESSQINAFQLRDLTPAPPRISAALAGRNVTLSWPAAYAGWSLQLQTNMGSPNVSTNWMNVPGTGFQDTNVITINPANSPAFFRLREP